VILQLRQVGRDLFAQKVGAGRQAGIGYRFVRLDGLVTIDHDQTRAHEDIRRLAARYYEDEKKVDAAMRNSFNKQHRITYRLPIRRVYADGF